MHRIPYFSLACGIGGMSIGFMKPYDDPEVGPYRYECLGGVDVDPDACRAFRDLTGAPCYEADLFSAEDYEAFHGHPPPPGWCELLPEDLRRMAGGQVPLVVTISSPCKGFSSLLSKSKSDSPKYQALNRLTERAVWLALEAWGRHGMGVLDFENVPRIVTRGAEYLERIDAMLTSFGFASNRIQVDPKLLKTKKGRKRATLPGGFHDLGVVGRNGATRPRYWMIARHPGVVANIIYQPPQDRSRLRSIGDVIGPLPPPGDPAGGPLHRLPKIRLLTGLRLAIIPAGGDWRNLKDVRPGRYDIHPIDPRDPAGWWFLRDNAAMTHAGVVDSMRAERGLAPWQPAAQEPVIGADLDPSLHGEHGEHTTKYAVLDPEDPGRVVTGSDRVGSGAPSYSDPRLDHEPRHGSMEVADWLESGRTIGSAAGVGSSNTTQAVADPRIPGYDGKHDSAYQVRDTDQPAGVITATVSLSGGAPSVADPRIDGHGENYGGSPGLYGVSPWDRPGATVSGSAGVTQSNMPAAIADPRLHHEGHKHPAHALRVHGMDVHGPVITSADGPSCGAVVVADPRLHEASPKMNHAYDVTPWGDASGTVASGTSPSCGGIVVADPRVATSDERHLSHLAVTPWRDPAGTATGASHVGNGAAVVADPRLAERDGRFKGKMAINPWEDPSGVVTGNGAACDNATLVADPRLGCEPRGDAKGPLGVLAWGEPGGCVIGSADIWAGATAVSDPRLELKPNSPSPKIIALDGTWHRPLTTWELAALQALPLYMPDGRPLQFKDLSDARARELIGNVVPPTSMEVIGGVMGPAIVQGSRFRLEFSDHGGIPWVRRNDWLALFLGADALQ